MLKPEEAQKQLQFFRVPDLHARRLARADRLPKELREIARTLAGETGEKLAPQDLRARQTEAMDRLDGLGEKERLAVFEVLQPRLAPHLERMGAMGLRLPYQSGWHRKAFRAPHHPPVTRTARLARLQQLAAILASFEPDAAWLAAWAPHFTSHFSADAVGTLLAAAVDGGGSEGEEVFQILLASAKGEHPVGAMGRHVTRALLTASRPEGWEFIEKLLLAAQRQEGLRQVILETADEAHPEAFRRLLRLVREHDLARFSAVVRALDVWFGFGWDAPQTREVNAALDRVIRFLEDPDARAAAIGSGDGETAYLWLWTLAFEDAVAATGAAAGLLSDKSVERRFVGTHLLAQLGIDHAQTALLPALEDPDLRVVARALQALVSARASLQESDLFERLERLLPRLPAKETKLEPVLWPWTVYTLERKATASALVGALGTRPLERLLPYLDGMSSDGRYALVALLARQEAPNGAVRETLFTLAGDPTSYIREQALKTLAGCTVTSEEAVRLEGYLSRKAGDLRRGVLSVLLNQPDPEALAGAERLLTAGEAPRRLAGLELLRRLVEGQRVPEACRRLAGEYRERRGEPDEAERTQLEAILGEDRETVTLDNALGLADPQARTRPALPQRRKVSFRMDAALACMASLDELLHQHRETPVEIETWQGKKVELLGNLSRGGFPIPKPDLSLEEDAARLPLREAWEAWWRNRPRGQRDADGFELLRAQALEYSHPVHASAPQVPGWDAKIRETVFPGAEKLQLRYGVLVNNLLQWLVRLHPPKGAADFLLDGAETTLTLIPETELTRVPKPNDWTSRDWREMHQVRGYLKLAQRLRDFGSSGWTDARHVRLWRLLRWIDEPQKPDGTQYNVPRHRPDLKDLLPALRAGGATEADLYDHLLGPRGGSYYSSGFHELRRFTGRKPVKELEREPALRKALHRCRERIIEVELLRGDTPTAASQPALQLRTAGGMENFFRLAQALGKESLVRGWSRDSVGKAGVFSHLIRATFPEEPDTRDRFAARAKEQKLPHQRLIELAVYAPQWAGHAERALEWAGFASAVWWLHAHTKDTAWTVDQEIREAWHAEVNEHTPLTSQDLLEGAVDVAWFARAWAALGEERWKALDEAARYASGGGGHKRAQLFAAAMLGREKKEDLVSRVTEKRHQDSLRALGLLPLSQDPSRDEDLLARYRAMQEFIRTGRQFGAQRRESEKRAATIGMQNLARTAGYPDPIRLEWAMEARGIADLAGGPLTVTSGDAEVALALDPQGQPELSVRKAGKPLKALPAALKKDPEVAALRERAVEIKRQASRMRASLEQAMCRGDAFTGAELRELMEHPVLAPMLGRLILIGEAAIGYPVAAGDGLRDCAAMVRAVGSEDSLRVAHPHDLLGTREWSHWQQECFQHERVQPFKQVFRELYVLTDAERAEGTLSRRYAGHQVNPRQALALLGARGWVNHPEEGVRRTFHHEGLTAWVEFLEGTFTPADVEGLTLEGARFSKQGDWKPLDLAAIPPRIFSEVMRDLDLVVSVAHQGGVDPEASASTVEMRAALVRETCALLKLANVRFQKEHVLIDGSLAHYSVHLGSAGVHRQPGGHLCIIPVHSQHRGRLFLPFADDDPRTAEVLSKVLLLARDAEIKDPTILEQILQR
jgi:hypothetical protein